MIRVVRLQRPYYGLKASRFSRALQTAAHLVPGLTWGREERAYVGYPDGVAAVAAVLRAQGVPVDTEELPTPGEYGEPPYPVASKDIRPYQETGIRFLLNQGSSGALLADPMGVGKSAQAATAARALKAKTLVLCPSHVRGVWARLNKQTPGQLQRWWPDAKLVCLPEGIRPFTPLARPTKADPILRPKPHDDRYPSVMRAAHVVVVHFDIVYAWVEVLIRWGFKTLVIDEAHLGVQNARSRRSKAIRELAAHARSVFALTGTPPVEKPRDLWNLIDTISPGRLGTFFNYGLRYCAGRKEEVTKDKIVWKFDGRSNLEELNARCSFFTLRRTKEQVGLQLPPMTRQVIDVDIPAKKRVRVTSTTLKSKRAMREALNLAADGKLNPSIELVEGHANEGHHVVVFTWRRAIAEYISNAMAARSIPTAIILGGVLESQRRARIEKARLQARHVMCCTIDATSTGIDLSYADVAVFIELVWEPHKLAQAEARLNRFGQTRPVLVQYIIARGTGDELVLDVVINKLETFEAVFGETGDGLRGSLEGEDDGTGLEALAARLREMED